MATKWKGKFLIFICSILLAYGTSGLFTAILYSNEFFHKDNYFQTDEFQMDLGEFAALLNIYELNNLTLEEAKENIMVSKEDIEEHRYRYGELQEQIDNITMQYEERIQTALNSNNQKAADAYIEERDNKIKDITQNFESDEYVIPKVKAEKEAKLEQFYQEKESFKEHFTDSAKTFTYYFENTVTGKTYTNLEAEETADTYFTSEHTYFFTDYTIGDVMSDYYMLPLGELPRELEQVDYSEFNGKIALARSLPDQNQYINEMHKFEDLQILFILLAVTSLILLILSIVIIKKSKLITAEIHQIKHYYEKFPIDTRVILCILAFIGAFMSLDFIHHSTRYLLDDSYFLNELIVSFLGYYICFSLAIIQSVFLFSVLTNPAAIADDWKKGISYRLLSICRRGFKNLRGNIKGAFLEQPLGTQVMLLLGSIFFTGLCAFTMMIHPLFIIIYLLLLGIVCIPAIIMFVRNVGTLQQLAKKTNELAQGKLGEDLHIPEQIDLANMAKDLNALRQIVKASQKEQAKSERLKTELITNVSHDLRTPLTSIINYTELLKSQQLSDQERDSYLDIIDQKSKRLKGLIEDLFEVSKMASGNVELSIEKGDLVQLLHQAIAEYDTDIQNSNLQFRLSVTESPVFVLVDGQKVWRVFDNLISNILKYSLEHSRVYISLIEESHQAQIIFKNISKYELNDESEELFERFKRGDTSRHTEGSGLGLAIAKSIIDLHDGELVIDTDGDLFKVSIVLQKVNI